ncbi:uncharacterized protein N7518_004240 [Penicillium psychrosexuale]|uniref:uncharacterized protein n=1 Tax=Penicillium psychrosexuale TaxID=1002107 RepID=UPI002544E51C|nr:uncharacterized protein N7518_004240 [Penicillium psychrosexuale]KAJ5795700.1 hypothetical protein N7518_004240 [Penicillium psychrosexuale]
MADAQPPRKPCGFCHVCNFPGHTEENCTRLRALGSLNRMSLPPLPPKTAAEKAPASNSSAPPAATTAIVATPSNKEEKKQE